MFDTADVYGPDPADPGANERLLRDALHAWTGDRSEVVIATKGGLVRKGKEWIPDGRAKHLKEACDASLRSLGVEAIDLYQLHAPDPKVPLETSLRALAALKREGKVRRVGLSNVRLEELETASEIVEIASVQVAMSPLDLTPLKNGVVAYCVDKRHHGSRQTARSAVHAPARSSRNSRLCGALPSVEEPRSRKSRSAGSSHFIRAWSRFRARAGSKASSPSLRRRKCR